MRCVSAQPDLAFCEEEKKLTSRFQAFLLTNLVQMCKIYIAQSEAVRRSSPEGGISMRILCSRGFNFRPIGVADAEKWLKSI
jgi:hypothetical protein